MRVVFLVLILLFLEINVEGQEISGTWTGNYGNAIGMIRPDKIVVELFLHKNGTISGASHLYYDSNQYEHYTIKGKYRASDSTIYFYEDSTLGVYLGGNTNILGRYAMQLKQGNNGYVFRGKWKPNDKRLSSMSTVVQLEKPILQKTVTAADREKSPGGVGKMDKNFTRATKVQSLIEISESERDSIKVELMDNMVVDGDIVSVYVNERLVLKSQPLTKQPITFYVTVRKNEPICKIKMAAENLGKNPPCTALMRVTVKGRKYDVLLSSSFDNSGMLELFLKE